MKKKIDIVSARLLTRYSSRFSLLSLFKAIVLHYFVTLQWYSKPFLFYFHILSVLSLC